MARSQLFRQVITGFDGLVFGEYNTDSYYNSQLTAWIKRSLKKPTPHTLEQYEKLQCESMS